MSNQSSFKAIESGVLKKMDAMIARAKATEQFLTRVVKRIYLDTQQKRWKTENNDSRCAGGGWKALNPKYAERKAKEWAGWAGQGRLMMIASGRLYNSIIGQSGEFREVVTNRSIAWATPVPYATYADDARPIAEFSKEFYSSFGDYYREWIKKGKL